MRKENDRVLRSPITSQERCDTESQVFENRSVPYTIRHLGGSGHTTLGWFPPAPDCDLQIIVAYLRTLQTTPPRDGSDHKKRPLSGAAASRSRCPAIQLPGPTAIAITTA